MCGIVGFNWEDRILVRQMAKSVIYRGPDQEGYFVEHISLGHRRLSILDLSKRGRQPMSFKDFVVVFNGEIYNFKEIREDLKLKGHKFYTETDTEVILHSYAEWGEKCVNRFNGMWAFCIYDKKKQILFISRDRFGIKPLYYYFCRKKFIFASELKAIAKHDLDLKINEKAVHYYFYQKYIGGNHTIFKNCFKLAPSCNIIFNLKNSKIRIKRYYNLENEITKHANKDIDSRIALIEELMKDAVEKRLIADVPVGSFLSGGIDSSLISALIAERHKNFNTFSIGFKEKSFDETKYSKIVSKHIRTLHHHKYVDINEDLIKYVIRNMDEPFGDSSILPTYILSRITKDKVTVSLSGDGGDELFGGYDAYTGYKLAKYANKTIINLIKPLINSLPASEKKLGLTFKMKKFVNNYDKDPIKRHMNWMSTFSDKERKELLNIPFVSSDILIRLSKHKNLLGLQLNDMDNYLPEDILKKVDVASMLNSLEVRTPFLDYRLVPIVLSLPEKYKIRGLRTKWLLKHISKRYVPKIIISRKKKGFSVPINVWIKNSIFIKEYLTNREYFKHNIINYDYVQDLLMQHDKNISDNSRQLWLVFIFNYWISVNNISYRNETKNKGEHIHTSLITIDTEPDCDIHWNRSDPLTFTSVTCGIPKLLRPIWDRHGINPIYFVSPEVVMDKDCCKVLKNEIKKGALIGAHLHSEYIAPNITIRKPAGKPSVEYPCYAHDAKTEYEKIKNLTLLIERNLGVRPVWYRAARYGADLDTMKSLRKLGYRYDSSATPHIDWSKQGGPDHSTAPEQPYWISKKNYYKATSQGESIGIKEYPITITGKRFGVSGKLFPNKWYFYDWLRPTHMTLAEMRKIIKSMKKKYKDPAFVMMFHSMEIMPGRSPFVRNKIMQKKFIKRLDKAIGLILKRK